MSLQYLEAMHQFLHRGATAVTASVMPVRGAVNFKFPCVDSMKAPPSKMKRKKGRNVKNVTTLAPTAPDRSIASVPKMALVQPLTKPTNDTTMMSDLGVVSPSAKPSIICVALSQW